GILTAFYRANLVIPGGIPVDAAAHARETLGGAVAVSETLDPALGEQLMQAAAHAFDGGVVITSLIGAGLMITAAVIAAVSLRGTRNSA
ncbi:MAG TPA: MFS transporter, partial [Microbacteriaceae bacterium]|nr:MFS transporter [Microbacteriaceae bacterium]